jgi:hypothetical protein
MADQDLKKPDFFASIAALGRSLSDLGRAFKGNGPLPPAQETVSNEPEHILSLPIAAEHSEAAQLLTQHTPGWHVPHPSRLPVPTYSPVMTAFGIVFIALGAVTVWPLSLVGAVIFVIAIAKWIGELLHD